MALKLTQGTIITNIRSTKYKGNRCYGIVISARCDIEQNKMDSIHIISAVPLSSWIQTAVFQKAVSSRIRKQITKIEEWAEAEGLDKAALILLGPQKALISIKAATSHTKKTEVLQACELWRKYITYSSEETSIEEIAAFLNDEGKSVRQDMLQNLFKGNLAHYGFIPEDAYLSNGNIWDGLVADYQDIRPLSFDQIKSIQRRDYDYWRICETNQLNVVNANFFWNSQKMW